MKQSNVFKLIALILSLFPLSSQAIPILDLSRFVDQGSTTFDKTTGLEWLDLPVTLDRTYIDVAEQLSPEGEFAGYRFATKYEVSEVFDFFQFPEGYRRVDAIDPVNYKFFELFGATLVHRGFLSTIGYIESASSLAYEVPSVAIAGLSIFFEDPTGISSTRSLGGYEPSIPYAAGSFLVRDHGKPHPVPEMDAGAAPIALSILLLTALVRWERRRGVS
jgi:hypothetical protein